MCKLLHPDRENGNCEKFKTLKNVHSILSDPSKRESYDTFGIIDDKPEIFVVSDMAMDDCSRNYAGE